MTDKVACKSTEIIVKSGDTAFALRRKYPGIKIPDNIQIGQKIAYDDNCGLCVEKKFGNEEKVIQGSLARIQTPPKKEVSSNACTGVEPKHLIAKGDSLSSIAFRHKQSEDDLLANNKLQNDKNGNPRVKSGTFLNMTLKERASQAIKEPANPKVPNQSVPESKVLTDEKEVLPTVIKPSVAEVPEAKKAKVVLADAQENDYTAVEDKREGKGLVNKFFDYVKGALFGGEIVVEKVQTVEKTGEQGQEKIKYTFRTDKTAFNYDEKKLEEYKAALPFIKFKEASGAPQETVYLCSAGAKTAGYGQVMDYKRRYNEETGQNEKYKKGDTIDEKMLFIEWFNQDIYKRIVVLEKDMPKDTPQSVKNAALSLSYNAGVSGVKNAKFFESIKKGDYDKAQGQMNWITVKMAVPKLKNDKPVYEAVKKIKNTKDIPLRNNKIKDPRTGVEYDTYQVIRDKKTKKPKELYRLKMDDTKKNIFIVGLALRRIEEMIVLGEGKISSDGMQLIARIKKQIANDKLSPNSQKHLDYIDSIVKNPQIIFDNMEKWDKFYYKIENEYKKEYLMSQSSD